MTTTIGAVHTLCSIPKKTTKELSQAFKLPLEAAEKQKFFTKLEKTISLLSFPKTDEEIPPFVYQILTLLGVEYQHQQTSVTPKQLTCIFTLKGKLGHDKLNNVFEVTLNSLKKNGFWTSYEFLQSSTHNPTQQNLRKLTFYRSTEAEELQEAMKPHIESPTRSGQSWTESIDPLNDWVVVDEAERRT